MRAPFKKTFIPRHPFDLTLAEVLFPKVAQAPDDAALTAVRIRIFGDLWDIVEDLGQSICLEKSLMYFLIIELFITLSKYTYPGCDFLKHGGLPSSMNSLIPCLSPVRRRGWYFLTVWVILPCQRSDLNGVGEILKSPSIASNPHCFG